MTSIKDISHWYFSRRALPYWSILLLDCAFLLLSGMLAFAINHGAEKTYHLLWPLIGSLAIYILLFLIGFRLFRTYTGVVRFSTFLDLRRIALAVLFGVVLLLALQFIFTLDNYLVGFEIADIVMMGAIGILLMWTMRIWVKILYDSTISANHKDNVFIYGVRQGGVALAKSINSNADTPYRITGFVSDCDDVVNKELMGVKVYPNDANIPNVMKKLGADTFLVSPLKSELFRRDQTMIDRLIDNNINIMMIPDYKKWDGKTELNASNLRPVNVEDLLPRETIEIDMKAAADLLTGRRILITGAAGSIGSEMVRQIAAYSPAELILVDQAETPMHDIRLMMQKRWPNIKAHLMVADIANHKRMEQIFKDYEPEYVFHAAAYKHVPMMEDNPYESIENNVNGTRIIADLAVKYGTKKFVMVSTDKAVNPTNVMGCSKRICEIYVQSLDKAIKEGKVDGVTQFVTTRFGNVLGSNGSVIPLFKEQIKNGGPITVTHPDIIRFFMLIPEACKLVIEAGTMGNGGEIYVFDMGKPVRIADLAERMIKLSGAEGIKIEYTGLRDGEK
ncbi:MAG: polysaccharide biosynthesis protein, partial [Muribaculaceae bacterium]|nr:polysaccharide biosynthesis protein [Muribaculaceae bacterium]